ncbi:nucleotidyltransferase domain-containing protein [Xylophilus sp. GW821-FHT01B05]
MTLPSPPLAAKLLEKHCVALAQALAWIPSIVEPAAIVATGSIIRGNPGPSSDLDLVVLHDQPWRRRVQRWFNDTPVEIFFNSEQWLKHSIQTEAATGRPVMAHMLATGTLLQDDAGRMEALQDLSRNLLERGPNLTHEALQRHRYAAATQVEDALDFGDIDNPDARRLRAVAVEGLLQYEYLRRNTHLPRPKERLALLSQSAPDLAGLLASALYAATAEPAAAALQKAAEQVLGTAGFFEWDSGPDHSEPDGRHAS